MERILPAGSWIASDAAEDRWIDAAIGGDAESFASLYDRHLSRVYGYVRHRLSNQSDAEDLTQQVFLQAWRSIGGYKRGEAPFVAWLLRIAHNLVASFYRRAKETIYLDFEPEGQRSGCDPEAEAFAGADRKAVNRAIRKLKNEQQQVILMRFMEHFEYAEIATVLGKSQGNIRVIQHRALSELRRLLHSEVEE